jgi:organic radical activating enzyme
MLLTGEFDIHIINACNLSCKNCSVLDFKYGNDQKGKVVNSFLSLEQVKRQVKLIIDNNYQLETLKILGGEPTTHPKFPEIVDFLLDSGVAKEVHVNTNALNMTEEVISACSKLDKVLISIYPLVDVHTNTLGKYKESGISKQFKKTHISVIASFEKFGVPQPNIEYTQIGNWTNCWTKYNCRTLDGETLYQCNVSYAKRTEGMHISEWGDKLDTMLDLCKTCPYPPAYEQWKSLKPKKDYRNLHKGLKLWEDYKNKIKIKEI